MKFLALLEKDFKNLKFALPPALFLGIPVLLILGIGNEIEWKQNLSWRSVFWITYFISLAALFYRSFYLENSSRSFNLYRMGQVPLLQLLWSQCLVFFIGSTALAAFFIFASVVFISPRDPQVLELLGVASLTAACLSPLGSFLGLFMQFEREYLFSLFFLGGSTPVILAGHQMSESQQWNWIYLDLIFFLFSAFICSLLFQFFFDDLTQSE